ncbi:MAG: ABC transporter-like protein, simple sugar transport system ATP-binding protein [Armatimonadetes bacterium CSP1-3]|nr:MAG: ABC transporter-like protein, simple sugar transport system ATP-binding protein [Armatimonadetes bacterium CSP1-3]
MAEAVPLVRMEEISKAFPGVLANDRITFEVADGEIHALVGENGAGKTTLMRILYGLERADAGRIYWSGRPVAIQSTEDAIHLGIGMVHQRFQLVPSLTAAESVTLGQEPRRGVFFDRARARAVVQELGARFGLAVNPGARIAELSVGEQQRVEILKLLYRQARLLVLDEPTTVLTPQEVAQLYEVLRRLVAEGRTVIFITHKLAEVLAASDRVTVLRRGCVVGTLPTREATGEGLARMIVGETMPAILARGGEPPGPPMLRLERVSAADDRGLPALVEITLEVRRGEILGIAGVEGNGQKELVEVATGVRRPTSGRFLLNGQDLTRADVAARRRAGLAVIPEDRYTEGLSLPMTIEDNLIATRYRALATRGVLRMVAVRAESAALMRRFDVRAPHPRVSARTLSGGNLQRVVVARELGGEPAALIAAHPTRGLDIAAARFVHQQLLEMRTRGGAVLLISADLDEIMALADRIGVLFAGRIVGELSAAAATREQLGLLMAGRSATA